MRGKHDPVVHILERHSIEVSDNPLYVGGTPTNRANLFKCEVFCAAKLWL